MFHKTLIAVAAAATVVACAHGTKSGTAAGELAPVQPPNAMLLPSGTTITATLDDNLSTANHEGEGVNLTVSENVMAKDGSVAIPAGTMLQGRLTGVHNAMSAGEPNVVRVNFDDLGLKGQHYPFTGGVIAVQVMNPPAGSPIGNVVSDKDANKLVSDGKLSAGMGTVITMGPNNPGAGGVIPAKSVFTIRSTSDIQVR